MAPFDVHVARAGGFAPPAGLRRRPCASFACRRGTTAQQLLLLLVAPFLAGALSSTSTSSDLDPTDGPTGGTPNTVLTADMLPWLSADPAARVGVLPLLDAAARVAPVGLNYTAKSPRTVALLPMTRGIARFAMNLAATLIAHGFSAIVAVAFDYRSLERCAELNLACADGRPYLPPVATSVPDGQHRMGSAQLRLITYGKHRAALELLRHNFTVLALDTDAVAFSNAAAQFNRLIYLTGADAVFAEEDGFSAEGQFPEHRGDVNLVNSGWYLATPLAAPLLAAWTENRTDGWEQGDQDRLNQLAYRAFAFCDEPSSCVACRSRGFVCAARHPPFFKGRAGACTGMWRRVRRGWWCSHRLPYLHTLCVTGWDKKAELFDWLHLWVVDSDGRPLSPQKGVPLRQSVCRNGTLPADGWFWDMHDRQDVW